MPAQQSLSLPREIVDEVDRVTAGGQRNYAAGYTVISNWLQTQSNVDPNLSYWFQQAPGINGDQLSNANVFIRAATRTGLLLDNRNTRIGCAA